jgi:hypothetical protein
VKGLRMGIRLSYDQRRKQDRGQGQRNRANQHLAGAFHDPTGKTLWATAVVIRNSIIRQYAVMMLRDAKTLDWYDWTERDIVYPPLGIY